MRTPLCSLLGIEEPILQGGMAWIADASLAGAVSKAGGLGIISAMNAGADYLREQIRQVRAATDRPFGVNIMLMSPHVDEVAQVVAQERVPVVTTGAGLPNRFMARWQEAGIKVVPVVPSTAMARMVERAGAAAVIAEGGESGGHVGDLTTMTLVPQVVDAVKIPVIAAGGIADGRGVAAALMLGAVGVQVGTRFLVADECTVHERYKEKVLKAKDIDTIVTGRRLGHPVRALKNPFSRQYAQMEYDASVSDEELEAYGVGALRRAAQEGDLERGSFLAGQCAAMVNQKESAKAIIDGMMRQAEEVLCTAAKWDK